MAVQISSTSPPSIHPIKKYDVFLSFRGADTRTNFTDHLYKALQVRQGIPTFRDSEQLEKGQDLSQLFEAIEKSTIAVVILSSNYASSTWCLREVAKIVECRSKSGLIVLPVFYDIEPTQVRNQTGNFKNYFDQHEQKFKDSIGKVKIWRQALTEVADLSGWDLKHRSEVTVIDELVKCVDKNWKLKFNLPFSTEDSKDFVGMDRVRKIELDLDIKEFDNIGVIGICGMPGVGKTTIAAVVFRRNWHHFEANSFIANVGETHKKNGLLHIQNQLYHDLLDSKVITMSDVPAERRKLRYKKVLIILDGVTELKFIEELVGRGGEELINWFGRGSRIIITTIDEKLLKDYEAKIHKVGRLNEDEARLLFFRKAFKKVHPLHDYDELHFKSMIDHPMRQYADLSYKFVDLADGLPLAIVALGNLLLNRTLDQWKAKLRTLEANNYTGDEQIFGILKVCIDGLCDGAKEIFFDIACFFKGEDKKRAKRIFDSWDPDMNLDILLEKSLVTIVGGKLWMHDLLQETGQKMVIGKPELELGKRSRLWHPKEAISVLKQDKGTSAVRGIFLSSPRPDKVRLKADSFSNMDFLRLLKIKNVIFSGCLEYDLSNELSFLEWHGFPSTSLPSNFEPEKLVELHLPQSQIKQLWEDSTMLPLEKLVIMDLSNCKYLTRTPDFQSVPHLESLILKGCTGLSKIHLPIGHHLQKLMLLNLEGCVSLSSLPDGICRLRSLTTLILSGCSKLANLPEKIGENMTQLSELDLDGTAIKELPASIKHLTGLIRLNLRDCKNLLSLPAIICSLTKLQVLNLSGCLKLDELPENLGSLVGLKELDASRSCIRQVPFSILLLKDLESLSFRGCGGLQLPASFSGLDSLTKLDLSYCKLSDGAIPADLDCLSSLDHLNLSGNSLVSVPESITKLSKLEVLLLNDCSRLRSLPHLPSSIQRVFARNCPLLGTYSNKLTVWTSTATGFCFVNSQTSEERKLQRIPISEQHLLQPHLQKFYEDIIYKGNGFEYITPHTEIPSWFGRQNTGSSVTILLRPEYFDGKHELMGFALCFVYEAQEHENMESTASNILAQEVKYSCNYSCCLSTCGGPNDDCPLLVCKLMDHDYVGSFRHWVYIAAGLFAERLNNRSVRAQVIIDRPGVEVKACGASLIYSGGVTEFVWNLNLRDEIPIHMRNMSNEDQSNEQEQETTDDHPLEQKHVPVVQYQAEMNRMISLFDTKARNMQSLDHDAGSSSTTGSSTQVPHQRLERPESNDKSNEQEQGTNNKTSTPIVGDQLRTNEESFLEGLFELGGQARSHDIGFIFSLRAILQWFKHQCIGSAVATRLPPELYNNKKWVGFALYVSFTLPPGDWLEKSCCFESELCTSGHLHSLKLYPKAEHNFMGPHRLLVIHIPRERFKEQLNQCSIIQANFVSSTPSVEAEMCGIRVVYEQDLKGLIRTITQCTIRSLPSDFNYGLSQLKVADGIGSFSSVFITDNLIKAAKSSERKLSTLQEPLRDSEFINGQKIHLKILAGTPYSTLKNKDSVVDWKRNLELLLESFFTLPDISIDLTLNESKINFSGHFDRPSVSILLQNDIPEWFSPQHPSESMVSELPPNLESDVDFMGFVVCAAFSVHASEPDVLKFLDSGHCPVLKCHLQSSSGRYPVRVREMSGIRPDNKFMWLYRRGFIFLIYLPSAAVKHLFNKVFELEVSFESDSSQVLEVQKCSLRLLYKQDVEEFKHTIIKCFTSVFDDADVIRLYIEEEDSGHNKRPNHADDRDSYGTTSSFGESEHVRKTELISKGETSGTGKKFLPVDLDSLKNRLLQMDEGQLLDFDRFLIYNCCFPPNEIVEWFGHNSNGPSVEIPLPPNSTDWIGLALCAYFEVLDLPTSNLDILNPGNPHHLTCYFETETDRDSPEPLHAYCTSNEEFQWLHLGGFLWLSYIPRTWFLDYHQLNKCINMKATIASDGRGVGVIKCGLRLLYKHDEQEFKETIMYCKRLLLSDHNNGKNKQHPGVSGETGSSGGNSVIEKTHSERLDIPIKVIGSSDVSADERDSYGTTPDCQGETNGKSNDRLELVAHVVEEERASSTSPLELIPFFSEIEPSASTDSSSTKFEKDQFRESVESFLAELFRNKGNRNDLEYGFILSPRVGAILPWFSHQTIGSEALVLHIPPDLYKDKKWGGLSLYVAFTVPTGSENILCRCSLSTYAGHAEAITFTIACPQGNFSGSRRLCFIYKPRAGFPEQWNKSSYICAFFEVLTPVVEVEMCGAHLVYEQDLIGMIETITHCTMRSPPVFYGVNQPRQLQRGQPFSDINMDTNLNELATRTPSTSQELSKSLVGQVIHLRIHGDTLFKKKDSVMEWKKNLELLLQCFFRFPLSVTLTLGGDVISSIGDSDPYCLCSSSIIPQKDIPTWFCGVKYPTYKLETRLPPNLENDDNWLGFVVCAAFSVHASEADVLHYLDSGDYPKLTCHLQWGSERALNYKAGKETNIDLKNEFMWLYCRGFIWLRYIPHRKIKGTLNKFGRLEASFRTDSISSKFLGVQECSLRVLYKKDVEEFKQTIIQCFTSFFDNEDVIRPYIEDEDYGHNKWPNHADDRDSNGPTPVCQGETSGKSNDLQQLISHDVVEEGACDPELMEPIPFFIEIEAPASTDSISTKITRQLRRNIESSLEQLFQGDNARHYDYGFILAPRVGAVMPWFSHQSIGRKVEVATLQPTELYKDTKWVGFALYVAFTQPPDSALSFIRCHLSAFPGKIVLSIIHWPLCVDNQFSGSRRLCFIHIPRALLPEQYNNSEIFARFDFSNPGSEVERCGIRVVYDEDMIGLVQTITQSTISNPPVFFSPQHYKIESLPCGLPGLPVTTSLVAHSKACFQPTRITLRPTRGLMPSRKFGKVFLAIYVDTRFKKKDTIEWKRNFELLVQSFFRLDLSIQLILGGNIAVFYNCLSQSCLFPQKEIPDWFRDKSLTATFVSTLPEDLESDNNWMGFVVCVAFSVHPHPTDVGNYKDSQLSSDVNCKFQWSSDSSQNISFREDIVRLRPNNKFMWLSRREFIWMQFMPRRLFEYAMMNRSHRQLEASFNSGSPALSVQKCSLRILYKQDMQEYKQMFVQCFASVFDNLDHSQPYMEDDCRHNKEQIHEDDQIDSIGTTSLSEDAQHETKTTVPIPQSETSGNSFNRFNSILFEPILYDNKSAVIFADFRGWEE